MSDTLQNVIAYLLVAGAAAYVAWTMLRWMTRKSGGGCGACHGCSSAKAGPTLISLDPLPADQRLP